MMSIEQLARGIAAKGKVSPQEAMEALEGFVGSILQTLEIGDEIEILGPSNRNASKTCTYFIKKLTEDRLLLGQR